MSRRPRTIIVTVVAAVLFTSVGCSVRQMEHRTRTAHRAPRGAHQRPHRKLRPGRRHRRHHRAARHANSGHTRAGSTKPTGSAHLVVTGQGWSDASGIQGPRYAPNSCHFRHVPGSKDVLPDPKCTPGAIDDSVTQSDLKQTVCRSGGYTDSVRPPESMTKPVKKMIMVAYGLAGKNPADYELDHEIPLEAGGSSSTLNLWPEPANDAHHEARSTYVHNDKDKLESIVRDQICYDGANLRQLQVHIARNWVALERGFEG